MGFSHLTYGGGEACAHHFLPLEIITEKGFKSFTEYLIIFFNQIITTQLPPLTREATSDHGA